LLSGWTDLPRPLHVVCAPKEEYLVVITVYVPSAEKWEHEFKVRKKKMKCLMCQGEMEPRAVAYTVDRKGYHLYVEDIPAYVCSQCGERFFDEKEVISIQEMIQVFESKLEEVRKVA
jgi:YgiT-type zinc finger domain-containing protein